MCSRSPALIATSDNQKLSIANLMQAQRYALYEDITVDNLANYHKISCRPITKRAEDDMELVSDIVTWGERYLHHWEKGVYCCSRCLNPIYSSCDKWKGPCVWPSFRKYQQSSADSEIVHPYNNYTVEVREVYCSKCDLFIGHQFKDGAVKGDDHAEALWRH